MNTQQTEILKMMMLKSWLADTGIPVAMLDADAREGYAKAEALVIETMAPMMQRIFGDAGALDDVKVDAIEATEITLAAWLASEVLISINGWLGDKIDAAVSAARMASGPSPQ